MNQVNPYKDLYIYYLEGCLHFKTMFQAENFIGNWEEEGFSFLFFSRSSDEKVKELVFHQPHLKLLDQFCMTYDQWHGGEVSLLRVGRFIIVPPWEPSIDKLDAKDIDCPIVLDPGVVFGTGLHPTTRDCLKAIEEAFNTEVPELVFDIGTGTGILALAAAKLGAGYTVAVDLNPLAVKTAQKNVYANELQEKIITVQGSAEKFVDYPVDFLIANVHYDISIKLINDKGFYRKKRFLLSGLLKSEADTVKDYLYRNKAEVIKIWDQNGIWFTFLGEVL